MDRNLCVYSKTIFGKAVAEVEKWCAPSSTMVNQKKHPDTYWIDLFDSANRSDITEELVGKFLTSFQLTNRVSWEKKRLAALLTEMRGGLPLEPKTDIPALAQKLRNYNKRETLQTSAASKIAAFLKPKAKVFIWDRLARKSAKHRERSDAGNRSINKEYGAFYDACERALVIERESPQFIKAVELLDRKFQQEGGVMADRNKIPVDFIERRLLDKLMFFEGMALEGEQRPRA